MPPPEPRTGAELESTIANVLGLPAHRLFALEAVHVSPGRATLRFPATPPALGPSGTTVHGGLVSLLAEPAAMIALLPTIPRDAFAVTADLHAQFLRPMRAGQDVELVATVRRAGRALAFVEVEARQGGEAAALVRVTKQIVPA
ncbi:HotDog domain-containing protein [Hyaloraphidium curvatum]|nr:HotDog domain-containing protein [Hyaloraphidium curvatum]